MIEFEGVTKRYPDGTVAVDDLSLTVDTGQITVLVGPSGCGKTTALRMINRMIEPSSGRILIDGDDVTSRPEAQLRREIGYVIQGAGLFPHRTVLDNVATVPILQGSSRREARTSALDLLERVGLAADLGERYPAQLSGGQQQRVGVARALAADPPVLLMDEPFSAVDPVVRDDLQQELLRLQGELGKTIVLVTHDIDEAIRLGDKVAVFAQRARLAQFAPPADLLAAPADDFVASLVGRDRGFRGLGFADGSSVALTPIDHGVDGLTLEVDHDGRPLGWRGSDGLLPTEGTFSDGANLRTVTDLVILSPAGAAIRVDAEGRADGLVLLADLAGSVRSQQRERLAALASAEEAG
ncbi:osmoprotectant transport system ATP-binding protein [Nocardioides sp. YR527]|uniref:ABC transporter ATP-binding protein n=1 Tax=Nocardioides sp. YR527 TaxID=1881028 RepID=UPI000882731D|nr:ABC transporter ATP-binding protein [Nocardioides sp. YR527]SDK06480.1 osmoprotectant transport system ATP-binding protein [Nocardioides sp. YR527]